MFTGSKIRLSELVKSNELKVVRDADVAYVAKIPSHLPNRLVPCSTIKNLRELRAATGIVAVVVPSDLQDDVPNELGLIVAKNPLAAAMNLHEELISRDNLQWSNFETRVDKTAIIEPSAYVSPTDVEIGPGVRIAQRAVILPRTVIKKNVVIGPGTVVGCDAFQVFKQGDSQRVIKQSGGVLVCSDVEIQANCTISRAVFGGFTTIGEQTILDSQIHVGHDCQIGQKVLIANQSSLAGRVEIEDGAYIAPNTTISNGLKISQGSQVTIGSVVLQDTKPGQKVTGYNAQPHEKWMMQFIRMQRQNK